jgi:FMN phosphatase YigB (HAD superfamily)
LHTSLELRRGLAEPDCLQAVLDQLPVEPSQTAFVSSCEAHRVTARSLGMLTIGFESHRGVVADVCLDRFSDLVHCLNYRSVGRRAA